MCCNRHEQSIPAFPQRPQGQTPPEKREAVLCSVLGRIRCAICQRRVRAITERTFLLGSSFRRSIHGRSSSHVIPDLEYGRSLEGHEVVGCRQEAVIVPTLSSDSTRTKIRVDATKSIAPNR